MKSDCTHECFIKEMLRTMYRYIQIASDSTFSTYLPATEIAGAIAACSECIPDNDHAFKNSASLPWFRINAARCDTDGNYPGARLQDDQTANMVELICEAKGDQKSADICTGLAERIALALGWQIISDEA